MTERVETGAAVPLALSAEARHVYREILHGGLVSPDEPGLIELLGMGVVVAEPHKRDTYVAAELSKVEHNLRRSAEERLNEAVAYSSQIPSLLEDLATELHRSNRHTYEGMPAVFLPSVEQVHAAIAVAADRVEKEILTAHPNPRSPETLARSIRRDMESVERGIKMRTIYYASERTNPAVLDWAEKMGAKGVEVRTLSTSFMRMIIYDRSHAFTNDYVDYRGTHSGAWYYRDPAMCGFVAGLFDEYWARARPLLVGNQADSLVTEQQEAILTELCAGLDQAQIATRMGVSKRTVQNHLSDLRARLNLETLPQLIYWWAQRG
ncbi:helix-turn-helix transcriptional regulator [Streptomyces sp. NBC_00390]|uniref:helix-turn-helix transcriptional regulator n=1 Tax=Streptomyces sp. NBC_00390 TaxID=2975736 RepID=UPI002E1CECBB